MLFKNASSRRGILDVLSSMGPQGINMLAGLGASILLARHLGLSGVGAYGLILAFSSFVSAIGELGIHQVTVRFASQFANVKNSAGQSAVLRWAFRVRVSTMGTLTGLFAILAPWVFTHVWTSPQLVEAAWIALIGGFFVGMLSVPQAYLQSERKFLSAGLLTTAQALLQLSALAYLIWSDNLSVESVITANAIATASSLLLGVFWTPAGTFFASEEKWSLQFPQLMEQKESPFKFLRNALVSSFVSSLTQKIDFWILGIVLTLSQIAPYTIAMRFWLPLTILQGAISTALWPRASVSPNPRQFLRKALPLCTLTSVGILAYTLILPQSAPWIFGPSYQEAILPATLLCLKFAISVWIMPISIVANTQGMSGKNTQAGFIQLATLACTGYLFTLHWGATGMALAMLCSDLSVALFLPPTVYKALRQQPSPSGIVK